MGRRSRNTGPGGRRHVDGLQRPTVSPVSRSFVVGNPELHARLFEEVGLRIKAPTWPGNTMIRVSSPTTMSGLRIQEMFHVLHGGCLT